MNRQIQWHMQYVHMDVPSKQFNSIHANIIQKMYTTFSAIGLYITNGYICMLTSV